MQKKMAVPPEYITNSKIQSIDLSMVDYTRYNPPIRRKDDPELQESLRVNGQLEPGQAVYNPKTGRYVLADANRRTLALREIGANTIKLIINTALDPNETDALVLFLHDKLNDTKMPLRASQRLQGALLGGPVSDDIASDYAFIKKNFKKAEYTVMINEATITPTVVSIAKRCANRCLPHLGVGVTNESDEFTNFVKLAVFWLIENETQQQATAFMRSRKDGAKDMYETIASNKPTLPRMPATRKQIRESKAKLAAERAKVREERSRLKVLKAQTQALRQQRMF